MSSVDFLNELSIMKKPVWEKFREYLPDGAPAGHYEMVRDYPERQGKYFRPGMVLLSAQLHGGNKEKAVLTAAAMQASEEWLLVHDDFEDHSLERRSTKKEVRPTLNMKYGDELAVNAGDALHVIMWKMLGDNVRMLGGEIGWKIFDKMEGILLKTIEGQYLELDWIRNKRFDMNELEYLDMACRKSAYYTTICPLQLGAITAGITEESVLENIVIWAKPFGLAFQIWDDAMNLSEESDVQGKEIGGDILEGKRTLILIHLLKRLNVHDRDRVERIYLKDRREKTEEEKNHILSLMKKHKSLDYAKNIASAYTREALRLYDKYSSYYPDSRAKEVIRSGIEFVSNRSR